MTTDQPIPPETLCALYLRDSGGDNQELSNDQQERVLRDWAATHHLQIGKVFRDSSTGTSTEGRDDFQRLVKYFQHSPPEQGILIWRSNRFGRNIDDTQYFKADLRRRGYFVHSITDNIPDGPMGRLIEFALDWKDHVFSEQLSEDVQRGLLDLVRVHGAVPGKTPRGFIREPIRIGQRRDGQPHIVHKWIPDPELIPAIRAAFEMRAHGATLRAIQKETRLYKSVNCWVTFFANPIYKGTLRYGGLTIPDYCPAIVTPEIWQAANLNGQLRRHSAEHRPQARRLASSFLLSGLARCARCGALLTGKIIRSWRYYACSRRMVKKDCDARQIPANQADQQVLAAIENDLLSLENLLLIQTRITGQYAAAQETRLETRTRLTRDLAAVNKAITNLLAMVRQYGPSDAIASDLRRQETTQAQLKAQLAQLEKELTPPPTLTDLTLSQIAAEITARLHSDSIEQKRYTLQRFIHAITFDRTDDAIRGFIQYYPPFYDTLLGVQFAPPGGHSYDSLRVLSFDYLYPTGHKEPKRPPP